LNNSLPNSDINNYDNSTQTSISNTFSAKGLIATNLIWTASKDIGRHTSAAVTNMSSSTIDDEFNNNRLNSSTQREVNTTILSPYILAGYWTLNVIDGKLKH
jgi:hypothetical protein